MYYVKIVALTVWVTLCYFLNTPIALPAFVAGGIIICLLLDIMNELI